MRKSKRGLVCSILALAMILTGTGYAFWSDTLNVTTTATTGDFDVTFADLGLLAQYSNEMQSPTKGWSIVDGITGKIGDSEEFKGFIPETYFARGLNYNQDYNSIAKGTTQQDYINYAKPYSNIDFDAELVGATAIPQRVGDYTVSNTNGSDQIAITIDNMYPGYAQAFRTDILNVGTLAARLSDITFDVTKVTDRADPSKELLNMIGIAILVDKEAYKPTGLPAAEKDVFKLCATAGKADTFTVGGVDFLRLSALAKLDIDAQTAIKNANLLSYPGSDNRMDLFIGIAMDPDSTGTYTSGNAALRAANDAAGTAVNDDGASQDGALKIIMDLYWDQFNSVETVEAPPNRLHTQNAVVAE